MNYFHGGRPGMSRGQYVLPPSITGAKGLAAYGNHIAERCRIYVTPDYTAAAMYAASLPKGEIYLVEPLGELKADPDCSQPGLSFSCERARVVKRFKLKPEQRRMIISALLEDSADEVQK